MTVSYTARKPDGFDWNLIAAAVQDTVARSQQQPTKPIHRIADAHAVTATLLDAEHVWIVNGYLVFFAVAVPWYARTPILSELLIVRVEPGGALAGVVRFLADKAEEHGAAFAAVGTAFARSERALGRIYRAAGLSPVATQFAMEPSSCASG